MLGDDGADAYMEDDVFGGAGGLSGEADDDHGLLAAPKQEQEDGGEDGVGAGEAHACMWRKGGGGRGWAACPAARMHMRGRRWVSGAGGCRSGHLAIGPG